MSTSPLTCIVSTTPTVKFTHPQPLEIRVDFRESRRPGNDHDKQPPPSRPRQRNPRKSDKKRSILVIVKVPPVFSRSGVLTKDKCTCGVEIIIGNWVSGKNNGPFGNHSLSSVLSLILSFYSGNNSLIFY